jgi:hypothetical protein
MRVDVDEGFLWYTPAPSGKQKSLQGGVMPFYDHFEAEDIREAYFSQTRVYRWAQAPRTPLEP